MPIRRLAAATSACLLLAACTSWATTVACADPPLILAASDPMTGESAWAFRPADGGDDRDITPGRGAHVPVLSPDGRTVAFAQGSGVFSDSTGWPESRVAVVQLDSQATRLVSADVPDAVVWGMQWSADGSEIAFIRSSLTTDEIVAVGVADGRERRLLDLVDAAGWFFSWSPDGEELLVPTVPEVDAPSSSAAFPSVELRRYRVGTRDSVVVETPHEIVSEVAWAPDGRQVAMAADIPGTLRTRLYVLDLDTGESRPVDRRRGGPMSMTWSGPYLIYTYELRRQDGPLALMRWNSRSGERMRLASPAGSNPVLSRSMLFDVTVSAPGCAIGADGRTGHHPGG